MARNGIQIALRVPLDMKAWIDEQSRKNLRSVSNEIVLALREKMERTPAPVTAHE